MLGSQVKVTGPWGLDRMGFSRSSCFPEQNLEKQYVETEDRWPSARGVRSWVSSLKPGLGLCPVVNELAHTSPVWLSGLRAGFQDWKEVQYVVTEGKGDVYL